MCGIGGVMIKDRGETPAPDIQHVRSMLFAMAHRGPDGRAEYVSDDIAIGVNRLAIRGTGVAQAPLFVHESGVVVACNGEIDNHRQLRKSLAASGHVIDSTSDVAVIAPLYLEKSLAFLNHLEGVFAIVLWDPRSKRLILARDRSGERHLYYAASDQGISFASELAAMMGHDATRDSVDRRSMAHYLRSGYCASPWTPLTNHYKVRPGEMIVWEGNKTRYIRYWLPPFGRTKPVAPSESGFDELFRDAIARQTDVDVNYGVLLSGGLDSSLITAVTRAVRPQRPLNAYCIRFDESSFDEGDHAQSIAERFDCKFTTVTMRASHVPGTLRRLIHTTGELLADPAWLPLSMVTERASRDVKMLLAGEGADEIFGGYPTYLGAQLSARYDRLPRTLRAVLRRIVEALPVSDRKVTLSFLLKKFMQGSAPDGLARHLLWNANLSPAWIHRLGVDYPVDHTEHDASRLIDIIQGYDFEHSLPDALMAKADRGGMCHGLEIRAPFLDRSVVEFAATLPLAARVKGTTTKAFLKRYARRYLPASAIDRRKRGLSVPLAQWLRGPLHDWAIARLSSDALHDLGIDQTSALELMDEHIHRRADHARGLWNLIVLAEWAEWFQQTQHATPARPEVQPRLSLVHA